MAQPYSFGSRPIFPEHLPKGNAAPQFKSRALEKQMKNLGPSPSPAWKTGLEEMPRPEPRVQIGQGCRPPLPGPL